MTRSFDPEDNLFLLPGPVKIHARILRAMMVPAVGHRSPEFKDLLRQIGEGLANFLQTTGRLAVMTASATAAMEAAVSNLVRPDEKVAVVVNGKFGERFVQIAKRYSPQGTIVVESPMGTAADLEHLEAVLSRGGVKAVAAVLNESSTGVANPGDRIGALCRKYNAYFIADGVTAVGGVPVATDKWGIDVLVVGSQKCLGAPPGLAFVSCSPDAYAELRSPSVYLDLRAHFDKWEEGETPFTPATHLFFATAEALRILGEESLAVRLERTRRLATGFRAALAALRLPLLPDPSIASDTITAVRNPATGPGAKLRDELKARHGITVAGGQGELKGQIFRVGHMGLVQPREIAALVAAIESELTPSNGPRPGATQAFYDAYAAPARNG